VTVTPPSHRVDVDRVADLYEEVIRHVGYGAVPARLPVLSTSPGHRHPNWELEDRARDAAVGVGLAEVMTFAFIDPDDDALTGELPFASGQPLPLANPLARTQSVMRRSLLPGLLAGARVNLNRGERALAIFEQGRVFCAGDGGPVERERLALALAGSRDGCAAAFTDLKGLVEELLDRIGVPAVAWRRGGSPWLDEAEGAVLVAGDAVVGLAGLLAGGPASRWELRQPVYLAEIDFERLAKYAFSELTYTPLPKYPSVERDMSIVVSRDTAYQEIQDGIAGLNIPELTGIDLIDVYEGEKIPSGSVSLTLRLAFQDREKTLTVDRVQGFSDTILAHLRNSYGAELRKL